MKAERISNQSYLNIADLEWQVTKLSVTWMTGALNKADTES